MDRPIRIAINGFGRIGRSILRALNTNRSDAEIEVVCINDIAPLDTCAYLLEFDSVFGPFPGTVRADGDALVVNDHRLTFHQTADISSLDLSGVDLVLECTGTAGNRAVAERGLRAGASGVLVSGPSATADVTVVLGANESVLGDARIVSNASCTTNALAPLLKVLADGPGVETAHMTTIHCYTGSQPMVDAPRGDLARSRAGALSMVPTTTSATKLIDKVLPELTGKITGAAVRVPVASVSAVDLTVRLGRTMDRDALNGYLREHANGRGILGVTERPLVSTDLRSRPESLVIATPETIVSGQQARIFGWYDNEWGFSNRMIDVALLMAKR
ncbi:type I glyceraldehyde-3-phosphate dehydrogenase [Qingshengfaniella alkalisoli]|uniref:Aldehyde dehydrogenase n=1 Tax=Qingshengfaniella alkalisoli TaxID=2599296 RepID=A0A5B8IVF1_9RHOB|nr:glyceraldehyde 3-phosphate dehydrogenase NAD-binding domain-containing protein [Qingshengfaniella alkalisoli]QDY68841.1 aldehyde dehydrogenase [Qingshengfaniella alkalisoli]